VISLTTVPVSISGEHEIQQSVVLDREATQSSAMDAENPQVLPVTQSTEQPGGSDDIPVLEYAVLPADENPSALTEIARERSDSPEDFSFAMNFDVDPNPEIDLGNAANDYTQLLKDTSANMELLPSTSVTDVNRDNLSANSIAEVSLQHASKSRQLIGCFQHRASPPVSPALPAFPHEATQAVPMIRTESAVSYHA
jgi:hypothetical protein